MKRLFLSLFMLSSLTSFTPKVEAINLNRVGDSALAGFMGGAVFLALQGLAVHGLKHYKTPAEKQEFAKKQKQINSISAAAAVVIGLLNYKYGFYKYFEPNMIIGAARQDFSFNDLIIKKSLC